MDTMDSMTPDSWHNDSALVRSASTLIARDFADDDGTELLPIVDVFDELRAHVIARIADMLAREPEHLMHVLYRLDVAEASVRDVLATAWPGDVPGLLAELVIERELRKVVTRREYARR